MLAGAIQQKLKAEGVERVAVDKLPDFKVGDPAAAAVFVSPGGEEILYEVGVQIRTRAKDRIAAEELGLQIRAIILDMRYTTIRFTDPRDGTGATFRDYEVQYIDPAQRPTYIPTPTAGIETSANYRFFVKEVNEP